METSKKLTTLKERQAKLKAKIQALEAAETSRERKRETRRKILVGAYYLDKLKKENQWQELVKQMDTYLTRDTDRKLFDLAPRPKDTTSAEVTDVEANASSLPPAVEGRPVSTS